MRAAVLRATGDVHVGTVPDPVVEEPHDALVRVRYAAVCGSDLWRYRDHPPGAAPIRPGHEFSGVVEAVGAAVTAVRPGDVVLAPFAWSDGTCPACRAGLPTSCPAGGVFGDRADGAQAEAVRVRFADANLVVLPVGADDPRMPALLTLADVMSTGHHAALCARVGAGTTVVVMGDGAVGLCAVLAARRLGAGHITVVARHRARAELALRLGADSVVTERGPAAARRVRALTGGRGTGAVLECVGTAESWADALAAVRDGGTIGYVGLPHGVALDPAVFFDRNLTLAGGIAPARTYIPRLLPDVLSGALDPSPVFDHRTGLDGVPGAYRAMAARTAIKALIAL
ncbi:zinc-binding dehydrogenase [Streptomyces specialis]|uniref:zinc-binding dehydrogenase n=1 Tax=Streptomyces specialis TaxID=498367 RepID=UPI00073EE371|nr:alcohol dehydrogenase catalytic domain-containing protein [Streptomyces specialis]